MGGGEKKLRNPKGIRAKIHQERLARFQSNGVPRLQGIGEAEIVAGYELSAVLRKWVVTWLAERPRGTDFMGPVDWLAEQTEINTRRVQGIVNGEFTTVPLSQADKLLAAIGRADVLALGEIGVYPNPHWSQEKWIEYMRERGCA